MAREDIGLGDGVGICRELLRLAGCEACNCPLVACQLVGHNDACEGEVTIVGHRHLVGDGFAKGVCRAVGGRACRHLDNNQVRIRVNGLHRGLCRLGDVIELDRHRVGKAAVQDVCFGNRVCCRGGYGCAGGNIREDALAQCHIGNLYKGDGLRLIIDILCRDGEGHQVAKHVTAGRGRRFGCNQVGIHRVLSGICTIGHRQRTVHIRNCIVVCHVFAVSIQNTRIARHVVARAHQRLAAGHSHDCSVTRDETCVGVAVVGQRRAVIDLAVAVSGDGDGFGGDLQSALLLVNRVEAGHIFTRFGPHNHGGSVQDGSARDILHDGIHVNRNLVSVGERDGVTRVAAFVEGAARQGEGRFAVIIPIIDPLTGRCGHRDGVRHRNRHRDIIRGCRSIIRGITALIRDRHRHRLVGRNDRSGSGCLADSKARSGAVVGSNIQHHIGQVGHLIQAFRSLLDPIGLHRGSPCGARDVDDGALEVTAAHAHRRGGFHLVAASILDGVGTSHCPRAVITDLFVLMADDDIGAVVAIQRFHVCIAHQSQGIGGIIAVVLIGDVSGPTARNFQFRRNAVLDDVLADPILGSSITSCIAEGVGSDSFTVTGREVLRDHHLGENLTAATIINGGTCRYHGRINACNGVLDIGCSDAPFTGIDGDDALAGSRTTALIGVFHAIDIFRIADGVVQINRDGVGLHRRGNVCFLMDG